MPSHKGVEQPLGIFSFLASKAVHRLLTLFRYEQLCSIPDFQFIVCSYIQQIVLDASNQHWFDLVLKNLLTLMIQGNPTC